MARIKTRIENPETGWSDWIAPVMVNYRMFCCDCGLAHDLQFDVLTAIDNGDGTHTVIDEEVDNGRVRFRARRNERSTAQKRRHQKK